MMNKPLLSIGISLLVAAPAFAQQIERREVRIVAPPLSRADVETRVKTQFAEIDANKDGFVTREEIAAHREARMKAGMDRMFDGMDANKDGSISRAEFEAHHAAMRRDMPPLPEGAEGPVMMMMHDGEGHQTETIMVPPLGAKGASPMAGMAPGSERRIFIQKRVIGSPLATTISERMFETADSNKDGKLSQAEVSSAALARFDRLDTNKDGTIGPDERQAEAGKMRMMLRKNMMPR